MYFLVLIASYIIGSVPFGYILTKKIRNADIRNYGSGNIGATNVLRVIGWKAALPVSILDVLKGVIAVLLAKAASDLPVLYLGAGLMAMIGHSFPIFLGFKGGKAVATALGALVVISGWITLIVVTLAGIIVYTSRYVSLGSIVGTISVPFLFWVFGYDPNHIIFGVGMAILVAWRHHANIGRLIRGTESKLGQKAQIDNL